MACDACCESHFFLSSPVYFAPYLQSQSCPLFHFASNENPFLDLCSPLATREVTIHSEASGFHHFKIANSWSEMSGNRWQCNYKLIWLCNADCRVPVRVRVCVCVCLCSKFNLTHCFTLLSTSRLAVDEGKFDLRHQKLIWLISK